MFVQRRNRNLLDATFTTLALIHHVTANNLRKTQRNAVVGLLMTIAQSLLMIIGFYLIFAIMGVRHAPLRGDFIVYIMTGIFMYMSHTKGVAAVTKAGSPTGPMMKHGPLNTAIMMSAGGLEALYQQTISAFVILSTYHFIIQPIHIENPLACYGMLLVAWFSGCCVGLIFVGIRGWWPQGAAVGSMFYQRMNMLFSGKMFLASTMPFFLLHSFMWNPLFHIIDQTRGFAFINYSARKTSLTYPFYCIVALLMIGLMLEFVSRKNFSLSTAAAR